MNSASQWFILVSPAIGSVMLWLFQTLICSWLFPNIWINIWMTSDVDSLTFPKTPSKWYFSFFGYISSYWSAIPKWVLSASRNYPCFACNTKLQQIEEIYSLTEKLEALLGRILLVVCHWLPKGSARFFSCSYILLLIILGIMQGAFSCFLFLVHYLFRLVSWLLRVLVILRYSFILQEFIVF